MRKKNKFWLRLRSVHKKWGNLVLNLAESKFLNLEKYGSQVEKEITISFCKKIEY